MNLFELQNYALSNWSHFKESITNISKNREGSLIYSEKQLYNFDKITDDFYNHANNKPTSVDALEINDNNLTLIEFKSGFEDKIPTCIEDLDPIKAICEKTGDFCKEYWDSFFKCRKLEKKDLINSIIIKAIESINTLNNKIFPLIGSKSSTKKININLIVVIDAKGSDGIIDMIYGLAKDTNTDVNNNDFSKLRQSLSRFKNKNQIDFYYDKVEVMSISEFKHYIS